MNLGAIVAAHAASQPEKPAVESGEASITYRELNDLARQIASRLKGAGVQSGDLVAVRMIDSPKHVAALVAVARIGGIILPVDWRSSAMEVRRLLDSFKPRLLLTDNERPVPEDLHPVGMEGIESEPADLEAPRGADGQRKTGSRRPQSD
jgi:acyl-CoA synthetase (AMP-forming)/AMP-acid ligase II